MLATAICSQKTNDFGRGAFQFHEVPGQGWPKKK